MMSTTHVRVLARALSRVHVRAYALSRVPAPPRTASRVARAGGVLAVAGTCVLGLWLASPCVGRAQTAGSLGADVQAPPVAVRARGTHFLLEAQGGLGLSEAPVYGGGLLFGAGGKLGVGPLRFYLMGGVSGARYRLRSAGAERHRSDLFVGMGLRTYLSLWPGVRVYGDALGGAQHAWDTVYPEAARQLHLEGLRGELKLGFGLQVRPVIGVSLGGGVTYRAFADDLQAPATAQGLDTLARWGAHGTVTLHF